MFAYVNIIPYDQIQALNLVHYPDWLSEDVLLPIKQRTVCMLRYNNIPYTKIQELLGISSPNTISSIIRLAAGSRPWNEGKQGGHVSILSPVIIQKLKNEIAWKRKGLNCMKTFEARQFIIEHIEEVKVRGRIRLKQWNSEKLIDEFNREFDNFELTDSIFETVCKNCGIYVLTADKLELLRRKCCNAPTIHNFFSTITSVLQNADPKYLYNADETGLSARRSFKVLTDDKNIHVTIQELEGQHISAMCAYSASGTKLPLFFILPKRVTYPEDLRDVDDLFSATSENGWITSHLWDIWCIIFVSHVSVKRAYGFLDPSKPIILFVDGHLSRLSPFGMRLLVKFNIICIVFPSHSSHILQPFDVTFENGLFKSPC